MKATVYLVHQTIAFPVGILYNFETFKENNFVQAFMLKIPLNISY